jgi:hypothetical protein
MAAMKRMAATARRLAVHWLAITVIAVAITYVDGFWMAALQGAVGAIERNEPPFLRWLHDSTLMLPVVFLAVLLAVLLARRWCAASRHELARLGMVALLIGLISGGASIVEVGFSSLRDYQYQIQHLHLIQPNGSTSPAGAAVLDEFGPPSQLPYSLYCNLRGVSAGSAASLIEYATLMIHLRALELSALVLLIVNLLSAAILSLMLRKRLWALQLWGILPADELPDRLAAGAAVI